MFNFGKIEFRIVTEKTEKAATSTANILRKEGFKIYDLRESYIVRDSDNSIVNDVYILCCFGSKRGYERFKQKHQMDEINYEGFKTLW